ncbi:MAG: histidine kinase [Sulfuricellaceae bacterium]|nr:histidine kinase [Sulfuricellaceae bacterium]
MLSIFHVVPVARMALKWKFKSQALLLGLAPALVMAIGLTAYDTYTRLQEIDRSLQGRGLAIVRQLSPACEFGVFSGNTGILSQLAKSARQEADVTAVKILDKNGFTLASEGQISWDISSAVLQEIHPQVFPYHYEMIFSAPIRQSQTEIESYLDSGDRGQPASEQKTLGYIVVEVSRLASIAEKDRLVRNSLLIALVGLAITALLALRMARQLAQPIMSLAKVVDHIGKGSLDERVLVRSGGEIAILERGVNNMVRALKSLQDAQEERRAILSTVLNSLDALVYVSDMQTYELLFINESTQKSFGEVRGKLCWQALQSGQTGPCAFCSNSRLLNPDGSPAASYVWEFQNAITQRWYMIHDSAIRWIDGRIVRLEIATDITESKEAEATIRRLESQILESGEQERQHIGHELHDGLGQVLTGTAFMCKALAGKLAAAERPEAAQASVIADMINQSIAETRQLARGLKPVENTENGLQSALDALAGTITKKLSIGCKFHVGSAIPGLSHHAANHLYRIAQEAVNNAIKHGQAQQITIELGKIGTRYFLSVQDNGRGFGAGEAKRKESGMGLQILRHRAKILGGKLEIVSTLGQGCRIRCFFDEPEASSKQNQDDPNADCQEKSFHR